MIKYITALVLLGTFGSARAQTNYPALHRIDTMIQREMKETTTPGLAVAIIRDGKVLHAKTYGIANIEWNIPATTSTVFHIASSTKLFLSTLVLKWVAEQRLQLTDPIEKYLPDAPALWKGIRIEHLLSHSSGIMWPKEELKVMESLKDSALRFPIGTQERYVNGDFFVLQLLLEKIGGKTFHELLADHVFQPLGMQESGYDLEQRKPAQVMRPLKNKSQLFTEGKNGHLIFKALYNPTAYDAAGLFLSLNDAVKWALALDKGKFIPSSLLDSITTRMPAVQNSNSSFTRYGWTYEKNAGYELIGHSGGPGLGDIIRIPSQKLTIIVLSNYADMYAYLAKQIAKIYLPDLKLDNGPKTFNRNLVDF